MFNNLGRGFLILILTVAVIVGGYLGFSRYLIEIQDRNVELCVDLNDLKKIAAFEKRSLGPILDEVRKRGIVSIGVFEETLPDAQALGELYYAKGSGLLRLKNKAFLTLYSKGLIKPDCTYIYAPCSQVRKRVYNQLKWVLGPNSIKFHGKNIIEVNEAEEEIRDIGLGISEIQKKYLEAKGFIIIPRVWNDPRFHLGNVGPKISALNDFRTIIFDGEEILGNPRSLGSVSDALKRQKIKYGYIEIVKQDGDRVLKRLMDQALVRVHSVPKRELEKISKASAVKRFVRAARERKVKLIYIRPFLPPKIEAFPVAYNLDYFSRVKLALEQAGFVLGQSATIQAISPNNWQLVVLGLGVAIGMLLLINHFIALPLYIMYGVLLLFGLTLSFLVDRGQTLQLQKGLALLAAIIFPAHAMIAVLARAKLTSFIVWDAILITLNVLAETFVGVFLIIGLLADYRFMLGIELFSGVKLALLLPIILVALYFGLQLGQGSLKERLQELFNQNVRLITVLAGLFSLGLLAVLMARSGNFVLPVPAIEKTFRGFLENALYIRPRTKEFLIGYPALFLAAIVALRNKKNWLWLLAAVAAIAPISVINSFCHIHTPILISMIRTINGLGLGIMIGLVLTFFNYFIKV